MTRYIPRVLAAALFGALAGPVCLVLTYAMNPQTTFGIDRLPPTTSGFYPAERTGDRWFVWTSRRADLTLAGLDRRSEWSCSVRFRGARPEPMPQPDLHIAVDGVTLAVRRATNDYQEVAVTAPAHPSRPGLMLTVTSSTTFVPGGSDPRTLGVQVDRLACRPLGASVALPPRRALGSAALAAALFGAALGFTGITAGSAVGVTVLLAAGQAVPLSAGGAPYCAYTGTLIWLAVWIAVLMTTALKLTEAWTRQALRNTARFVVVFSAGVLYLKLLALLHPSKALVDALFHAHRFESVLAGGYYFTQLSTSATPFPYAIGLYLFAAPWSVLTHDHVALLRIVVSASEVVAGALLYLMVVRTRGDRLMGAVAVALFNLVPLSYVIIGYANLTNAFGQSVALATLAAVTLSPPQPRRAAQFVGVILLATLGLISHISTFLLLLATLAALAFFYRTLGGPALRAPARGVLLATAISLFLSVVLYWGHFGDVYKMQLARLRAGTVATLAPARTPETVAATRGVTSVAAPALGRTTIPLGGRAVSALSQTLTNLGWPILILALIGVWRLWLAGGRDRLVLALAAWGVVCLGFVAVSVLAPGEMRYQQDAWEFIARVEHTTCPAAVVLAALGATWAWRAGTAGRLASAALMLAAFLTGARMWAGWFS